jgi:hypothetical protein
MHRIVLEMNCENRYDLCNVCSLYALRHEILISASILSHKYNFPPTGYLFIDSLQSLLCTRAFLKMNCTEISKLLAYCDTVSMVYFR